MLNESAVIASLHVRMLQATKFDRQATQQLESQYGIASGITKVKKVLIPDDPLLAEMKTIANQARNYHYDHTLPWQWKGGQMLPSAFYMEYTRIMADFIREFDDKADQFCNQAYYEAAVTKAMLMLKGIARQEDYPSPRSIRSHFMAAINIDPIPSSGDFRVDLHASELQALEKGFRQREEKLIQDAREHLYKRLLGYAEHAKTKLGDPKAKFHYTLPKNIAEFTRVCESLNISDDKVLNDLANELKPIGDIDAKDLREDEQIRREAAQTATNAVEKIKRQMEAFRSDA